MKKTKNTLLTAIIAAAAAIGGYFAINNNDNTSGSDVQESSKNFLFISDVHLNSFEQDTPKGGDTGMILWNAFLAKADSVVTENDPDFIVYAGDLPTHVNYNTPIPDTARHTHNKNIATILTDLRDLATRHKKSLMYLPGNNDGIAGDYASFADENGETPLDLIPENNNPYPMVNMNKSGNTPPYIASNPEPKIGYFSAVPVEGIRVIAMNTVLHSKKYYAADSTNQMTDAADQMSWVSRQLDSAKKHQEKALIALHIPPGIDAYNYQTAGNLATNWKVYPKPNDWNNQFLQILDAHQATIIGVLYGHTHMDELRRFYNPSGTNVTEIGISAPGITPNHGNNPGFKIVKYDATSKELLDFTTFYTSRSVSIWGNNSYSFNNQFGYSNQNTMYENLSKENIDSVTQKMDKIFMVMNGSPSYDTQPGIEVKTEK